MNCVEGQSRRKTRPAAATQVAGSGMAVMVKTPDPDSQRDTNPLSNLKRLLLPVVALRSDLKLSTLPGKNPLTATLR
jgi:hypothetical protein